MPPTKKTFKKVRLTSPFVTPEIGELVREYCGRTGKTYSQLQNEALIAYKSVMLDFLKNDQKYETTGELAVGTAANG